MGIADEALGVFDCSQRVTFYYQEFNDQPAQGNVEGVLCYRVDDPFCVQIWFDNGEGQPNIWQTTRDMLYNGMHYAVGMGDVRIRPFVYKMYAPSLAFTMFGFQGTVKAKAVLTVSARDVQVFLRRTERLVPVGSEEAFQNLDNLVNMMLRHDEGNNEVEGSI